MYWKTKDSKNALNYRKKVEEAEAIFGVKEKVFNRNTDNEATMKAAFKEMRGMDVMHTLLQKAIRKLLRTKQHSS